MMYLNHNTLTANDLITSFNITATAQQQTSPFNQISAATTVAPLSTASPTASLVSPPNFQTSHYNLPYQQKHLHHHYHHPYKNYFNNLAYSSGVLINPQSSSSKLNNNISTASINTISNISNKIQPQRSSSTSSSTSSSNSTSPSSTSSNSSSTTSSTPATNNNKSLQTATNTSTSMYPVNFAYYNPTTINCNTSSTSTATNPVNTQLLANTSTSLVNLSSSPAIATAFSNQNYQVLSSKNSNLVAKEMTSNHTNTRNGLVNNEKLINPSSFSYLLNTSSNPAKFDQNYLTTAYLPATNADLFFTTTSTDLVTTIPTSYVTAAELTPFRPLTSNKPLIYSSKAATGFSSASLLNINNNGINKRKRRFKKPPELRKVLPKNSLMLLHELRPNVEYRFICQSGPIHRPIFTMCVDINEHKFEGCGKTKKEARMAAAEKAYQFLLAHPEYIQKSNHKKLNASNTNITNIDSNDDHKINDRNEEIDLNLVSNNASTDDINGDEEDEDDNEYEDGKEDLNEREIEDNHFKIESSINNNDVLFNNDISYTLKNEEHNDNGS